MACATNAAAEIRVRYHKGQATFISTEQTGVVQVALPAQTKDRRSGVMVVVFNRGNQPASLGYENVAIRTSAGVPLKLITYEELQHQAKTRANWNIFFAALVSGLNYYAADRSAYSGRYYSPIAAQMGYARADALNDAMFSSISGQLDAKMAQLDGTVLRTTTIDPGTADGGAVIFDLPKATGLQDLVLTVTYAGEAHEIALNPSVAGLQQASASDLSGAPAQVPAMAPSASTPAATVPVPDHIAATSAAVAPEPLQERPAMAAPAAMHVSQQAAPPPPQNRKCGLVLPTDPNQNACHGN